MENVAHNIENKSELPEDVINVSEESSEPVAEEKNWPNPFETKRYNPDGSRKLVIRPKAGSSTKKASPEYINSRIKLVVKGGGHTSIIDRSSTFNETDLKRS